MTSSQRTLLLFLRGALINTSVWLTAAGKPATGSMQVLPFLEVSGNGGSIRVTAEDVQALGRYMRPNGAPSTSWSLTDAGRKMLEDMT